MKPCRIAKVHRAIVSLPMDPPVITPIHHIDTVDNVLVTVETEDGLQGIAYLWCFGIARARVLAAMVDQLAELAVGRDALDTVGLWDLLWRENNFFARSGVAMLAQSALDIACWDIRGKACGMPLWQLLGGSRRASPAYAGGLFLGSSIDELVAEAQGYVRAGFRGMKMRTGASRLADDVERVGAVRAAIGPDVALMVDAVQAWEPGQAVRACRALEQFDLSWMEDPVSFDDHAGLARVAAATTIPLCAGENDYSRVGFQRLIDGRCIRIAMPDLQRVGGVTEWMRVAALADSHRMRVTPHVFHEMSAHLLAAVGNGMWLEYVPWWEPLFRERLALVDGAMTPPDAPGLGLQFDMDAVDRHRVA